MRTELGIAYKPPVPCPKCSSLTTDLYRESRGYASTFPDDAVLHCKTCGYRLYGKASVRVAEYAVRQWEDKEGNKRYTTEIVAERMQMLGAKLEYFTMQLQVQSCKCRAAAAQLQVQSWSCRAAAAAAELQLQTCSCSTAAAARAAPHQDDYHRARRATSLAAGCGGRV